MAGERNDKSSFPASDAVFVAGEARGDDDDDEEEEDERKTGTGKSHFGSVHG